MPSSVAASKASLRWVLCAYVVNGFPAIAARRFLHSFSTCRCKPPQQLTAFSVQLFVCGTEELNLALVGV